MNFPSSPGVTGARLAANEVKPSYFRNTPRQFAPGQFAPGPFAPGESALTAPLHVAADIPPLGRYSSVRAETERLAVGLTPEDQQIQSMPDCSPVKWHRAHTTWFFETFVLGREPGYRPVDPSFGYLFNSYYEAVGARHPRPLRGLLSRPSADEIAHYRREVDRRMARLLESGVSAAMAAVIELGLNHEQQHQELILTDVKHAFWSNPLRPAYAPRTERAGAEDAPSVAWIDIPSGIYEVGAEGRAFAFDNEGPRHRCYLNACRVASRPVTCLEYARFIAEGGYDRPELWLSDGWARVREEGWRGPLYWTEDRGAWTLFTLEGTRDIDPAEPVQHVSFYEASAYAAWAGRRLPTEFEWEIAMCRLHAPPTRPGRVHSDPIRDPASLGEVWDWTGSAYAPYPGYRTPTGAIGEYNGKFMSGQMVLRGASWATAIGHSRLTYRNFFPPAARWQASGFRLAEDT